MSIKPIKVFAGDNVITVPQDDEKHCGYCKVEISGDGISDILWVVCSPECDIAMSYLLDGIPAKEVKKYWEEMKKDPAKLKEAQDRMVKCVFVEPPIKNDQN